MARRNQLPFVVECKSTYPFFETIAAFDCEASAKAYAFECSETNPQNEYRVYDRTSTASMLAAKKLSA